MEVSYGETQMMKKALERVEEKVEELDDRLGKIEDKIDLIIKTLGAMNKDTESMGKHVEFVEGVYNQVKRPFHFLMGSVEQISQMRLIRADPGEETNGVRARHIGYGPPVDL